MSGKIINVADPGAHLPSTVVVDTSLVVSRLLTDQDRQHPLAAVRSAAFFALLMEDARQAIITPTAYSEVLHISIRIRYQQELRLNCQGITARYGARITSGTELYKRDMSILKRHTDELERLRLALLANNFVLTAPEDLGPISSGRRYDAELVRLIGRYGLDTNDALILMEVSRLSISAIVTMDRDMERALPDFDVYLWR